MGGRTPSDLRVMIATALERVPDDPWRVDTRGMLLSGRAEVTFPSAPESVADGFLVTMPDAALVSIVGRPPRALIKETIEDLEGDLNVLCQPADAAHVTAALPGWTRTLAILHALRSRPAWAEGLEPDVRIFHARDAPSLAHVPPALRRELLNALRGRTTSRFVPGALPDRDVPPPLEPTPVAASWSAGRPVSFCYPVLRTEAWWDISIETLAAYRGQGHGARAVRAMTRRMWETGRAPVWGATVNNVASLALAGSLGFQEVGRLSVFTPRQDAD
jgi:GNAT superfamily N-acetyltransferase